MEYKQEIFNDYNCMRLKNGSLSVWITLDFGPRVIALAPEGGANLFAELPEAQIECPGSGMYSLRGGHRLWYAPEYPPRTYLPDDDRLESSEVNNGFKVTQQPEHGSSLRKSIIVRLPDEKLYVVLDHEILNLGIEPQRLAPWVITMMRPGGTAVMPQQTEFDEEFGCQPNRTVNLWPYTPVNSPHITFSDRYLYVQANMKADKLKIGAPNPRGWIGYVIDDTFFVKFADYDPQAYYYDRQSSSQFYCDPGALEMETLGPRVTLEPGETVKYREVWKVFQDVAFEPEDDLVDDLVKKLGLE